MGLNLGISQQSFGPAEDQTWLGSRDGTGSPDSITLDATNLVALFTSGVVPSGIPLKRVSGKYQACIGTDVPEYYLFTTTDLTGGGRMAATDTPAAGIYRGEIIVAKIPSYTGKTTSPVANTSVGLFKYV